MRPDDLRLHFPAGRAATLTYACALGRFCQLWFDLQPAGEDGCAGSVSALPAGERTEVLKASGRNPPGVTRTRPLSSTVPGHSWGAWPPFKVAGPGEWGATPGGLGSPAFPPGCTRAGGLGAARVLPWRPLSTASRSSWFEGLR